MSTTINSKALDTMASTSQRPGAAVATAFGSVRCMVLLLKLKRLPRRERGRGRDWPGLRGRHYPSSNSHKKV
jgi:hypothetical protein